MIIDFTEEGEKQGQALEILRKIHRTKAGKEMIHTTKMLTDSEGYDFPCPLCGAEVTWDDRVVLAQKRLD